MVNKNEKKKEFELAVKEVIESYKQGELFPGKLSNPLCTMTLNNNNHNCYRCPFNVLATEQYEDYGCMVGKHPQVNIEESPSRSQVLSAEKFLVNALKLVESGINPYDANVFNSKTKSIWAYSLRAIDLI